jgi:hypothetical protein
MEQRALKACKTMVCQSRTKSRFIGRRQWQSRLRASHRYFRSSTCRSRSSFIETCWGSRSLTPPAHPIRSAFGWALLRRGGAELMLNTAYEDDSRPASPEPARVAAHADTGLFFECADVDVAYKHLSRSRIRCQETCGSRVWDEATLHCGPRRIPTVLSNAVRGLGHALYSFVSETLHFGIHRSVFTFMIPSHARASAPR